MGQSFQEVFLHLHHGFVVAHAEQDLRVVHGVHISAEVLLQLLVPKVLNIEFGQIKLVIIHCAIFKVILPQRVVFTQDSTLLDFVECLFVWPAHLLATLIQVVIHCIREHFLEVSKDFVLLLAVSQVIAHLGELVHLVHLNVGVGLRIVILILGIGLNVQFVDLHKIVFSHGQVGKLALWQLGNLDLGELIVSLSNILSILQGHAFEHLHVGFDRRRALLVKDSKFLVTDCLLDVLQLFHVCARQVMS